MPTQPTRRLTPEEIEVVEGLWTEGAPRATIADEINVSVYWLDEQRWEGRQLSHLPKRVKGAGGGKWERGKNMDPTPEEIAQRAAEVRARWSEEDEINRRTTAVFVPGSELYG